MAAVKRDISIVYGAYTISTMVGEYTYNLAGDTFSFSCDFLVQADTPALLKTAEDAAKAELNEWNNSLTVTVGGAARISHSHSSNTGMLTRGSCTVPGRSEYDTQNSTLMTFAVRGIVPGTQAITGGGGFREYNVSLAYDTSRRRTLTFQMTYTADGANTALVNWDAASTGAKARAATYITALTGDFDLVSESIPTEDQAKQIVNGSLTYRQRLIPETEGGSTDDDFIIDDLKISRRYAEGSYKEDNVAVYYDITFSASLDWEQTTNNYDDMYTVYEDQVKPFLKQHLKDVFLTDSGGNGPAHDGEVYILNDAPTFNTAANKIDAMWMVLATHSYNIISMSVRSNPQVGKGWSRRKLMDGKHHTYSRFTQGVSLKLSETITVESIGGGWELDQNKPYGYASPKIQSEALAQEAGDWVLDDMALTHEAIRKAPFQGQPLEVYTRTWATSWTWEVPVSLPPPPVFTEGG